MSARGVLLVLMLAAAAWLALFGDKTPPGAVVAARAQAPAAAAPATTVAPQRARAVPTPVAIEALAPRAAQAGEVSAPVADLFRNAPWRAPPKPTPAAAPAAPAASAAAPAPVPPQPYRLIGKKLEAEAWEVFLGRGDMSYIARVGDTLEGAWRVQAIAPPTLTLIHLPSGQQQTLDIGSFP